MVRLIQCPSCGEGILAIDIHFDNGDIKVEGGCCKECGYTPPSNPTSANIIKYIAAARSFLANGGRLPPAEKCEVIDL